MLFISIHKEVFPVQPIYIFPTHMVFILYFFFKNKFLKKFTINVIIEIGINDNEIRLILFQNNGFLIMV